MGDLHKTSFDEAYSRLVEDNRRFMEFKRRHPREEMRRLVDLDYEQNMALVVEARDGSREEIIAMGRYYLDEKTNRAEVALVVRDEWQNRHIGRFLFRHLATIAKRSGIGGFTAEVLRGNQRMQVIFNNSGYEVRSQLRDDVYSFHIDF